MVKTLLAAVSIFASAPPGEVTPLDDAVVAAWATDARIQEAKYGYQAALESRSDALSYRLPQISGRGNLGYLDSKNLNSFGTLQRDGRQSSVGVEVNQSLYSFGRNGARKDIAHAEIEAARYNVDLVINNVIMETVTAYFDVHRAKEVYTAHSRHVGDLSSLLEATEAQHAQDLLTTNDVALVRSRHQQAIARRESAHASLEQAYNVLIRLTMIPSIDTVHDHNSTKVLTEIPDLSQALLIGDSRHQLIKKAEMDLERAKANAKLKMTENHPDVGLRASWNTGNIGGTPSGDRRVGLQFSMPLFDGGRSLSAWRRSKKEVSQAKARLNVLRRDTEQSIRQNWSYMASSRRVEENWQAALDAERATLRGIERAVEERVESVIYLLEARDEMISVHIEAINAKAEADIAHYKVLFETGIIMDQFGIKALTSDP